MRIFVVMLATVLFAAMIAHGAASAQESAWTKVYDAPTSTIRTIEMFDEQLGLAASNTTLLRTIDGGATWSQTSPDLASAAAFGFADAQRVWAVGGVDRIRRSDDGGLTWTAQPSGTEVFLSSIAVVSREDVWVAGSFGPIATEPQPTATADVTASDVAPVEHSGSALLHTTDGGDTWVPVEPLGYRIFYGVTFVGDDGWLIASPCAPGQPFNECPRQNRSLLRTSDGGETWELVSESPEFTPQVIAFADAQHGYGTPPPCTVLVCERHLWRTEDGGETWTELPLSPTDSQHLRIDPRGDEWVDEYRCDPDCVSSIWRSRDDGETWEQHVAETPYFVFDVNRTHALVQSSVDGVRRLDLANGAWSASSTPLRPAFWYVAFDPQSDTAGYATSYGAFQVTHDGGRSWQRIEQPAQLGQLHAVGRGVIWATVDGACDGCPTLYRSGDGARTWSSLDDPWWYISTFQATDATRAWVVADNGLWRTDDAGATWTLLQDGNSAGNYGFVGRDFGYSTTCGIYRCEGAFRVSHDGGVTWETRPLPPQDGLTFVTPDIGFAMRYEGNNECPCTFPLMGTTDGGRTWTDLARLPTHLMNLTFTDAENGWATGGGSGPERAYVYRTTDGGRTWTPDLTLPANAYPTSLHLHGHTLTVRAGVGFQGLADHTFLFERQVEASARPPLIPPETGTGNHEGGPPPFATGVLLAGAMISALGLAARVRRAS